jgi:hypothetical protein
MSSLLASFEAQRQHRLPAAAQVKLATRDFHIIDWYINPTTVQRTAVIYDFDRDERVLDFLTALYYNIGIDACDLIGVAESKGTVTVWCGDKIDAPQSDVQRLEMLAQLATYPTDEWHANGPVLVPTRNGQLVKGRLDQNHPLRAVPERFQLGVIEVRS